MWRESGSPGRGHFTVCEGCCRHTWLAFLFGQKLALLGQGHQQSGQGVWSLEPGGGELKRPSQATVSSGECKGKTNSLQPIKTACTSFLISIKLQAHYAAPGLTLLWGGAKITFPSAAPAWRALREGTGATSSSLPVTRTGSWTSFCSLFKLVKVVGKSGLHLRGSKVRAGQTPFSFLLDKGNISLYIWFAFFFRVLPETIVKTECSPRLKESIYSSGILHPSAGPHIKI